MKKINFEEAKYAMKRGKKVKTDVMVDGVYLYMKKNGVKIYHKALGGWDRPVLDLAYWKKQKFIIIRD